MKNMLTKKYLTIEEKIKILHTKKFDLELYKYLVNRLNKLYVEILNEDKEQLMELMTRGKLEGWCWQSTESAIIFLNDNDYIERGNLYLDEETPEYYHSWICFNYKNTEYVFDPSLCLLCKKSYFNKLFIPDVKAHVTAKQIKEELLYQITNPKTEQYSEHTKYFALFLENKLDEKTKEKIKNEVRVHAPEDVTTPLYRNGSGYTAKISEGKIKKLTVHYYLNC